MRKSLIILFSLCFVLSFSQETDKCFVQKKKSEKMMYKLNKNLSHYSFKEVKEVLQEINRTEGISSQVLDMYTLIYWLKDDVPNSTMYA